jgi:hypothetical protein
MVSLVFKTLDGPLALPMLLSMIDKIEETDSNDPPLALYEKKSLFRPQVLGVISSFYQDPKEYD